MKSRFRHSLQLLVTSLDIISVNVIFFITFYLFKKYGLVQSHVQYSYFICLLNLAWILPSIILNLYDRNIIFSFEKFTKLTIRNYLFFLLIVIVSLFFFRMLLLSRIFVTVILLAIPIGFFINRFICMGILLYVKKGQGFINRILIIGYNNLSKKVSALLEEDGVNKEIIGYCEESENVHELSNYPIISSIENTMKVCEQYSITEIYSTIAPEHNSLVYRLMQKADESCIRFKIVPDLGIFMKKQMHVDNLRGMPVISMRKEPLEDISNKLKKRVFDVIVSSLVIVLILSWLVPLISLLILIESSGGAFFIQNRTGKNNKNFKCIKFRSMYKNDDSNLKQATRDDDRITKVGHFLRRTSLDEFPQFINVFRGQMSIVGPRPHMLKHTNEYSKVVSKYMVRQFLKPGITGWAQVNGFRGETQTVSHMEKRVEYDLWYLENWSLILDLKIVFMTAIKSFSFDTNAF